MPVRCELRSNLMAPASVKPDCQQRPRAIFCGVQQVISQRGQLSWARRAVATLSVVSSI